MSGGMKRGGLQTRLFSLQHSGLSNAKIFGAQCFCSIGTVRSLGAAENGNRTAFKPLECTANSI